MAWLGILLELVGYAVARACLPLLSFGWIYVELFRTARQRDSRRFYRRDESGRVELRQVAAVWIGLGIFLVGLVVIVAMVRAALQAVEYRSMMGSMRVANG